MTPAQAAIIARHALRCPVQREAVARAREEQQRERETQADG